MFKELFRDHREEAWKQLAEQLGGKHTASSWKQHSCVQVDVKEWTITLDCYAVSTGKSVVYFTRFRAPYINPDGFRFSITRKNFLTPLGKLFGLQDIVVGYDDFDTDFVIKSNDEVKVQQFFSNPQIRQMLIELKEVNFSVLDDEGWFQAKFPEGVDELYFNVSGIITDLDRLKRIFDLFAETLDWLCQIGSAYEGDPEFDVMNPNKKDSDN